MLNLNNSSLLLTTAINYTNGDSRIGHLFEGLIVDYYNRALNFLNNNNHKKYFLTGTD